MKHDDIARAILDGSGYVVLASADAQGTPWSSPVWFAHEGYRELFWVSAPDARHSRNIAARPSIGMVVFDSTVAPGSGQAVYMTATAQQVEDPAALEHGLAVFSRASQRSIGTEWRRDRVSGASRLRLYGASVHEHWILDPDTPLDVRTSVDP